MDRQNNYNGLQEAMELLSEKGFDGMGCAIQILFNHAMRIERERHLNAQPYERSENRQGYANGYKPKTVKTVLSQKYLFLNEGIYSVLQQPQHRAARILK